MKFLVLSVLGAVLVHNSAAKPTAGDVPGADIYTDNIHYRFTPETTTEDLVTEMLLAEDGDQRRTVAGPPDARDPLLHPEATGSLRSGRRQNLKASTGAEDGSGDGYSIDRMVEIVKGQVLEHRRPTIDENLELLPEFGSGIIGGDPDPLSVPLEVLKTKYPNVQVDGVRPPLSFKDYALLSIEDHQRRQQAEDLLPPSHEQMVLSSNPTNPHDALHMRQVGYLCGEFESPLFHGELRAVNESAFLLRNVYINSRIHFDQLKVVFKGPNLVIPIAFNLKSSDKLIVHNKLFMLDTKKVLADLHEVTLQDDLKHFSVSMNISQCRRPSSLWGSKFEETKDGLSTGAVVLHTADLLVIKNFTYPGNCPAAYFWAGSGRYPEDGFKVPTIDGSSGPLRVYENEDVLLKLPDFNTFYDLDYIGVYCQEFRQMLGHHLFKSSVWTNAVLPPAFTSEDRIRHPRIAF